MKWYALALMALSLFGCGSNQPLQKPQSLEHFLAYAQTQCTQVRVDALNFAASGSLSWDDASKAQRFADSCRGTVEVLRISTPDLGCLLPTGDRAGTCGTSQLQAYAEAASWLSRAAALMASKGAAQ